ncbi:MAG: FGGY-family carbohydrate kinase [Klebsiella pneumoniae]|nr:FGGY-family carbohydrate kinase [Klebsiella pneumoniae]
MQATAKEFIIALDEGTTNAKAVVLDSRGKVIVKFSQPLAIQTPRDGWVVQSGEALVTASLAVIASAVAHVGAENVAALAISNQRETAIGWYRDSGEPINAAITWQCTRSAAFCDTLRHDRQEQHIKRATGLPIAPLFSASKMRWLLDATVDGHLRAERGEICLGTIDSWLLWNLTAGEAFCCDYSNASRTQLLNLHRGEWDDEMLALFGIPRAALPEIKPSSGLFGHTKGLAAIPDGIPIMSMIGDSHAALFGHALGEAGCVKATYGTGSSVMAPVKSAQCDIDALATTVAWHDGDQLVWGLEGNIPHTGDAVAWMADSTGLSELSAAELAHELNTLPASVDSTLGVYFVPALTGLGAPWWDDSARGVICGLMMVDGGPTNNDWLMQYQADLLGCPVMRSDVPELSAIGAALLARKALHPGSTADLQAFLTEHSTFQPDMARHQRLQTRWQEWRHAVDRTLWKPDSPA